MRDTSQFYGRVDRPTFDSPRRITFYEVCLTSYEDGIGGREHMTELADLSEALESIYARRTDRQGMPHLTYGLGATFEASTL
jgi:hypothetical protein